MSILSPHWNIKSDNCSQAALRGTNYIDHLILGEDILNLHLLLKETHHEVNLCCQAGINGKTSGLLW